MNTSIFTNAEAVDIIKLTYVAYADRKYYVPVTVKVTGNVSDIEVTNKEVTLDYVKRQHGEAFDTNWIPKQGIFTTTIIDMLDNVSNEAPYYNKLKPFIDRIANLREMGELTPAWAHYE